MTEQERELDLALADAMQENAQLRAKVADYEGLIRDLTDALRAQGEYKKDVICQKENPSD